MKNGKVFILSGPSGAGKTTLYKKLLQSPNLRGKLFKTVSVTTRPMRAGEEQGRDYFFISPKMFEYKKVAGHFLESQKVFGYYYGTPRRQLNDLLMKNRNVLLCIDVKGAKIISQKIPSAVKIFIKTPSLVVLKKRLLGRRSEDEKTIHLRLQTAHQELQEASQYNVVIINADLEKAYKKLEAFIASKISE